MEPGALQVTPKPQQGIIVVPKGSSQSSEPNVPQLNKPGYSRSVGGNGNAIFIETELSCNAINTGIAPSLVLSDSVFMEPKLE